MSFRGIPFAQPPVGPLRWLPPQPLAPTAALSDIHATTWGHSCPQIISTSASIWTVDTPRFDVTGTLSENCLSLSIYAPQKAANAAREDEDELLPAIVWMYGGGMITGGQQVLYFDPSHWIQRTPEPLLVTIKYALSIRCGCRSIPCQNCAVWSSNSTVAIGSIFLDFPLRRVWKIKMLA